MFSAIVSGASLALESSAPIPGPRDGARFAGDPVLWVRADFTAASPIRAFATSTLRVLTGASGAIPNLPASSWTLLEVSPIPSAGRTVFLNLAGGLPVQYVLLSGSVAVSGELFQENDPLATTMRAWLAVCFQDRIMRDPPTWAREIEQAMAAAGVPAGPSWPTFVTELEAMATWKVRVLDHIGRPLAGATFNSTLVSDADGVINLLPGSSVPVTFSSAAAPLIAGVESKGGAFQAAYTLANERHVQVLDADAWLAQPPSNSALPRWRTNSHVEPLVDGTPYFKRLVQDLLSAKPGGGAWFAGWIFVKDDPHTGEEWPLDPADPSSKFVPLLNDLHAGGAEVRLLVNDLVQIDHAIDATVIVPIFAIYLGMHVYSAFAKSPVDPGFIGIAFAGITLVSVLAAAPDLTKEIIEAIAEDSDTTIAALPGGVTTWSSYPVRTHDNPQVNGLLKLGILTVDEVERFGVYHQKIVVIRTSGGDHAGYIGGIDINSDRIDTPLHRALRPFHDVQVRVTGPAVRDLAATIRERLDHEGLPSTLSTTPAVTPNTANPHLVQIARTYFVPGTGSTTTALPFAVNGEKLIYDSLLKAIAAARDYIYIEDQFLNPGDEMFEALRDAAGHAKALVITVPMTTELPFGEIRRLEIVDELATSWGTRLRVGAPMRRFINPTPVLSTNHGRCILRGEVSTTDTTIKVGPAGRVPAAQFWVFVGGELMFANRKNAAPDAEGNVTVDVSRAPLTGGTWGARVISHDPGEPVLCVRIPDVYVHSKVTIIDDVFACIGSANLNRRSHFHDGEASAFVIPQHLKRDPENPARVLRCQLWAELMGLPPEMGASLFADPLSALRYFDRSWYAGNPWQSLRFDATPTSIAVALPSGTHWIDAFMAAGYTAYAAVRKELWNGALDPTTELDPNKLDPGPEL